MSGLRRTTSKQTVDTLLRDSFSKVDLDGDGRVSSSDIMKGLKNAGIYFKEDEYPAILKKFDQKNEETITFEDFVSIHEGFIESVFYSFDTSRAGYITEENLKTALQKLGIIVTQNEAQQMIGDLSAHDSSQLSLYEFRQLYTLLRARMCSCGNFEAFMWDPNVRNLSKHWWKASVEIGEGGLRAPLCDKQKKDNVKPLHRFYGGCLSGIIEAILLTPLDVTKTRLQLDKDGRYRGMIDCGRKLFRSEGPLALYKGFTPWSAHVISKNGSRFYFNAVYRRLLADQNGEVNGSREFLAGAMAGATEAVLIVTPFEVIKTRLQGQDKVSGKEVKYRGPIHAAVKIIKNEGLFSLWKGVSPTIARQGLNQACSFWSNSFMKTHLWDLQPGETLSPWKSVLTGMLGAIPGPCINCPMDVVKTRLMAQDNAKGEIPKYRGLTHAVRVIYKEEGISALYKGLIPRLSRLCPSYGIQWLVMDQVTAYYRNN